MTPIAGSSSTTKAWLQIHFCVVLWGFTPILGKLITLPALPLVWWRMILVAAALLFFRRFWQGLFGLTPRLIGTYAGIGVIVSLHWLAFYGSVKLSNASVAVTCMALTPIFVAFVEPVFAARRFDVRELFFGFAVIPGIVLVVGGTPVGMRTGLAVGVLAALLASVFTSLNKRFIEHGPALAITGLEMGAGVACLTLLSLLPFFDTVFVMPIRQDAIYLLILAIACTLLPYALSLIALRRLTAFSTSLAVNMEPVYAVLLAIVILGEQRELPGRFYIGVAIILAVVFSHPLTGSNRISPDAPA